MMEETCIGVTQGNKMLITGFNDHLVLVSTGWASYVSYSTLKLNTSISNMVRSRFKQKYNDIEYETKWIKFDIFDNLSLLEDY